MGQFTVEDGWNNFNFGLMGRSSRTAPICRTEIFGYLRQFYEARRTAEWSGNSAEKNTWLNFCKKKKNLV